MLATTMGSVEPIIERITDLLEGLKKAVAEKNKGAIAGLSSELVGQTNLLVLKLLEINIEATPSETGVATEGAYLELILAVLEQKKRAAFLLTECLAYVLPSKRNAIGANIQQLTASIYDIANEGVHYLSKDAVFERYADIIYDLLAIAPPTFRAAKQPVNFYSDCFMPWIHGIPAPIRKAAKRYFRDELPHIAGHHVTHVTFEAKAGGVQIGTRAITHFDDGYPPITFHVKAHQNYAAMGSMVASSQRKGIDLKELFVYKVLEFIGLGSKVHFITHQASEDRALDKNALFIATQDVSYTKTPATASSSALSTMGKEKIFRPISELYDLDRQKAIGDERFLAQFQAEMATSEITQIKFEATIIDIIARVFRLGDLNGGNFGRVSVTTTGHSYEKWKLFDFTVPEKMEGRYIIGDVENTTEGFIKGNGTLRHPTPFLSNVLMCRDRGEKIQVGHAVIAMLERGRPGIVDASKVKMSLPDAIRRAVDEIIRYMSEPMGASGTRADILGVDLSKSLADLDDYSRSALENFDRLRTGLHKLQSSPSAEAGGGAEALLK